MGFGRGGIPAKQLVRDYGRTLDDFTGQVDALVTKLSAEEALMPVAERHREVCAAVWAAIVSAFAATSLSEDERQKLEPLLREVLIPYWERHCDSADMHQALEEREPLYLEGGNPDSQIITANAIVRRLLDAIGAADAPRSRLERMLTPLFAHRMLGDTHHIDELRTRFGIQLSLLTSLCAATGLAEAWEPALRLLRLS